MAGDIGIREQLLVLPPSGALEGPDGGGAEARATVALARAGGRIMHRYGSRVLLAEVPPGAETRLASESLAEGVDTAGAAAGIPDDLTETEQLGVEAFYLRQSAPYSAAKANRPHQGETWEGPDGVHPLMCADIGRPDGLGQEEGALAAQAGAPALSARLTGKVAVGIVIVDGPTAALQFTAAERTKVVAEVQNGLGWLGAQNAAGAVSFSYEIKHPSITAQPLTGNPTGAQMEDRFRDPAMATLGYSAGLSNVTKYANDLRTKFGTDWAYVVFFVKYPTGHFAYASIGGPRIIMQYANDGWGPDNIDRVFAHETGHIFGAPDEYASANCNCGGSWGYYGKPNSNCETCATGGGVKCLMRSNDWEMCSVTPYHLGFPLAEQRYSGVFRAGTGKYALWLNASHESFVAKWNQWAKEGLRLVDLDIVQVGSERRYNGVWVAGTDAYGLWLNADWDGFVAKWTEWSKQGLRLIGMEVVRVNGKNLYSGVFRAGNWAHGLWGNATWDSFNAKWQEWSKQNFRLIDLTISNFGGERRYSGVFAAGTDAYGLWVNTDWASFEAKWKEWSKANLRLVDLEITNFDGQRRYSGVFRGGSDAYGLWAGANFPAFKAKWEEWHAAGLRLIDIEVTDPANTVQSPTAPGSKAGGLAAALGIEADENGGDGYGGIFGTADTASGDDLDTGGHGAGSAAAAVSAAAGDGGHGGLGGLETAAADGGAAGLVGHGHTHGGSGPGSGTGLDGGSGTGLGGYGSYGMAPADGDGLGGTGGDTTGGSSDLDTGGIGG